MRKKYKPVYTALGKAVDDYQHDAGMTCYRIAQVSSITEATMSNIKLGKSWPTIETLDRIAEVLGTKSSLIIARKEFYENE